jgi:hypothetical protein
MNGIHFFAGFLTTALGECGYNARCSIPTQDNIVCGIVEDLAWTDFVLAVLTDFNPNVWYELGARHSLIRGGTVMICEEKQIKKLPFDLKHILSITAFSATTRTMLVLSKS